MFISKVFGDADFGLASFTQYHINIGSGGTLARAPSKKEVLKERAHGHQIISVNVTFRSLS